MDDKQVAEFLAENSKAMKEAAKEAVLARIKRDLEWQIPGGIQAAVNAFMTDEIAPEVVKALHGQKGEIVSAVAKAAKEIGDELAKKMVENAVKQLSGYSAKEILGKLIGA